MQTQATLPPCSACIPARPVRQASAQAADWHVTGQGQPLVVLSAKGVREKGREAALARWAEHFQVWRPLLAPGSPTRDARMPGGCLAGQPARTLARAALVHSGAARELRSGLSTGRAMAPAIVRGASRGRNTCMHPDLATERAHPDHLAAGSSGLRGSGRSGRCACAGQRTPRVDGHSPFFGHLHHWPDHSALTAIPSLISPSNGISRAPAVSRMQA